MTSRDKEAARKFAVEWSTKGKGKIANLAGCYLQALAELEQMRTPRKLNKVGCYCESPDEKGWRGWCNLSTER